MTAILPNTSAWREAWDRCGNRANAALERLSLASFALAATVGALGLGMLFYAPNFVHWTRFDPHTFEWARAMGVWQQAQAPWDAADTLEPALRWRLLPALVIHLAGGHWWAVALLPWLGLVALLGTVTVLLERRLADRFTVALVVLLLATTGTVLTVTNFLGINDAWFLLPLILVVFAPSSWALLVSGLAGPWVDERFLLALPLAWLGRILAEAAPADRRCFLSVAIGPALYLCVRLGIMFMGSDHSSGAHIRHHLVELPNYIRHAPLGWWMGYRFAWLLLVLILAQAWSYRRGLATGLLMAATGGMVLITLVAADLTRSTNLLVPLLIAGLPLLLRRLGAQKLRGLLGLLIAGNLLTPCAWVSYVWVRWFWPLPAELWRWWH